MDLIGLLEVTNECPLPPAFNDNGWPGQRGATASTAHFNVVRPHKIHPVYLKSCPTALDHILDLGVEETVR